MTPLTIPSLATVWSCPCTSTVTLRADITPRCCGRAMDDEGPTAVALPVWVWADVEGSVELVEDERGEPVPTELFDDEDVLTALMKAKEAA